MNIIEEVEIQTKKNLEPKKRERSHSQPNIERHLKQICKTYNLTLEVEFPGDFPLSPPLFNIINNYSIFQNYSVF